MSFCARGIKSSHSTVVHILARQCLSVEQWTASDCIACCPSVWPSVRTVLPL